jgi:hypothetical protein
MARVNWLDDDDHPAIDSHMQQLEHFASSIADGQIDQPELDRQEQNLITVMREVEPMLTDEQHAKVTQLLAELAAYTVMQMLHEMTSAKIQAAIK